MTRLILSALIMLVAWADMCYTLYAVHKYHLGEWNYLWKLAINRPGRFMMEFTAYHVAALVICWFTFPVELYWIVLAVRLFVNAKNIGAVRRAR